jgi:membrane protein implicated in regulation of membrane protease activity
MPDWVLWVIAAAVLATGEVAASFTFIMGPIAFAALLAALVAAVGGTVGVQLAAFIIASVGTLALLRPIARRHMHMPAQIRTGTDALIGTPALVLDRVDQDSGQVKIRGEVWTARSYDEDDVFEQGARVQVIKIDGATALVHE